MAVSNRKQVMVLNQIDVFFFIGTGKCKVGRPGLLSAFTCQEGPFLSTYSISCGLFCDYKMAALLPALMSQFHVRTVQGVTPICKVGNIDF